MAYFRAQYWGGQDWAGSFWGAASIVVPPSPPPAASLPSGGVTHRRRRRILLPDGNIYMPATEEEFQDYIASIIRDAEARREAEEAPQRPRRRRIKGAVQPPPAVPRMAVPAILPDGFYEALANYRDAVLNYSLISQAWANYQAEMDDDETVTLLLLS